MRGRLKNASFFLSGYGIDGEIPVSSVNVGLSLGATHALRTREGDANEDCIEATYYVRDVFGKTLGYVESHCGEPGEAIVTTHRL